MNLYTKRFIPTKRINEFKDCKTNRYYCFESCLDLLNSLDSENEILKSENRQLKVRLMVCEEQINEDERIQKLGSRLSIATQLLKQFELYDVFIDKLEDVEEIHHWSKEDVGDF